MQILVKQTIEQRVWKLLFTVTDFSEQDVQLITKFGEPQIDMGGDFGANPNTFSLPSTLTRLRSDFPYLQNFDTRQTPFSANTQIKVEGYRDEIVSRITDAMDTLRASSDSFTADKLYTI